MSRTKTNTLYTNFSRGLVTEASPLAFPMEATTDELNCDIQENGKRVRRWGYDRNGTLNSQAVTVGDADNVETYVWRDANLSGIDLLVMAAGGFLYFYKINSNNTYTYQDDLSLLTFRTTGTDDLFKNSFFDFASGRGVLFVVNRYMDPVRLTYDENTGVVTGTQYKIYIRDFEGLDDGLAIDQEPSTLSAEHHYNLRNQGWVSPNLSTATTSVRSISLFNTELTFSIPNISTIGPIHDYYTSQARYPSNAQVWWVAKDNNEIFDPTLLVKTFFGTSRAPRGHFILEAFNKNRTGVSGVAGITTEASTTRPETIAFASGRVFYGHKGAVYFSPTLYDGSRAGQCYQEADPTSENISDLLETDGGVIEIPEALVINKLMPLGDGVLIFGVTGVWFLSSGGQGFSAIDYSLNKVSSIGTSSPKSVVSTGSQVFWWSEVGIQAVQQSIGQFGPIAGQFDSQNISDDSIKKFFNNINVAFRNKARGYYDPAQNKIWWLYSDVTGKEFLYNKMLIFDMQNQAFIPWAVNSLTPGDISLNPVLAIVGAFVSPYFETYTYEPTFLSFVHLYNRETTPLTYVTRLGIGNFINTSYTDFEKIQELDADFGEDLGRTYSSYLETGYETLGDLSRRKQAPICYVYFEKTDNDIVRPHSCFMQARFDWSNGSSSGKWSTKVQAYRVSPRLVNPDQYDVVSSRNKVRGSGKAVQFRFSEDRAGYGFILLGWQVFYEGKNTV